MDGISKPSKNQAKDPIEIILSDRALPSGCRITFYWLWNQAEFKPGHIHTTKEYLASLSHQDVKTVERHLKQLIKLKRIDTQWDKERGSIIAFIYHPSPSPVGEIEEIERYPLLGRLDSLVSKNADSQNAESLGTLSPNCPATHQNAHPLGTLSPNCPAPNAIPSRTHARALTDLTKFDVDVSQVNSLSEEERAKIVSLANRIQRALWPLGKTPPEARLPIVQFALMATFFTNEEWVKNPLKSTSSRISSINDRIRYLRSALENRLWESGFCKEEDAHRILTAMMCGTKSTAEYCLSLMLKKEVECG
jgi:hypothetical protein